MSKKYLNYLFRNYRIPIVFFAVLCFAIAAVPYISGISYPDDTFRTALHILSTEAIMLTYVLPVLLFAFAHRRRSADLYFALPVSRRQQLITSLVFAFAVIYGIFLLSSLIFYLPVAAHVPFTKLLAVNGAEILVTVSLLLIHSCWFLIANNVFDGIVMIASYTGVPLMVVIATAVFQEQMIAGGNAPDISTIAAYLSPLYMSADTLISITAGEPANGIYVILTALWGALGAYGLTVHFIRRNSERAEQLSDDPLAYRLIINFYALAVLICIACWMISEPNAAIVSLLLVLLFVYVVAQFVYRRKIRLEPKIFITFGALVLASFVFCFAAFHTHAFGLADRFTLDESDTIEINYYATVKSSDISILEKDEGIFYGSDQIVWVNANLTIPEEKYKENQALENMLEAHRKSGIEFFYSPERNDITNCHITFGNRSGLNGNNYWNSYSYTLPEALTVDDLKMINNSSYGTVTISDSKYDYPLNQWLNLKGN